MPNPFLCFNSSPEAIRLVVMMYVKYPLSLRNFENLLAEREIEVCHASVGLSSWSSVRTPPFTLGQVAEKALSN